MTIYYVVLGSETEGHSLRRIRTTLGGFERIGAVQLPLTKMISHHPLSRCDGHHILAEFRPQQQAGKFELVNAPKARMLDLTVLAKALGAARSRLPRCSARWIEHSKQCSARMDLDRQTLLHATILEAARRLGTVRAWIDWGAR